MVSLLDRLASELLPNKEYEQSDWWKGEARDNQLPPQGDWFAWLILAGRGFGKTRSIMEWGIEQARTMPGSTGVMVGATASDVYKVLIAGDSGAKKIALDDFKPTYNSSKNLLTFPNGSAAWLVSAEEPDRLRGLNTYWAICDELAAWRYPDAWDQLLLGLRLGEQPRVAIATTPRPTPLIKRLLKDSTVAVTRGSTYENRDNLAPSFLTQIINRYEGTRLGRQELNAEVLDDTPGALFRLSLIEAARNTNPALLPNYQRVVVAIDPAVTNTEDSDETGIIAAALGDDGHAYILRDATVKDSPDGWARAAYDAYTELNADRVIAETNNGGDMVEYTMRTVAPNVSFNQVRASRGKQTRAEPVAALYEQGKVHHVGMFAKLEDQMCSWTPGDAKSPDRMDALVWALTELMLDNQAYSVDHAPKLVIQHRG